jgi:hypothetical protein
MIQMLFFLRFRSQLRRTRPALIADLDDTITGAAAGAGGRLVNTRRYISAVFDEKKPVGLWLDLLVFLKTVHKALENAASDLYGHSLILGREIPESEASRLCRALAAAPAVEHTGIWCSPDIQRQLAPYSVFDKFFKGYEELQSFKNIETRPAGSLFPCREKIERALAQGGEKNTILLGPEFVGKRDGLYHYCSGILGSPGIAGKVPPLAIRFGAGGRGLVCFADALSPDLFAFLKPAVSRGELPAAKMEELEARRGLLFQERLREEMSPCMVEEGRRFLELLLLAYGRAARGPALIILENLETASGEEAQIFNQAYTALEDKYKFLVFALCNTQGEESLKNWNGIFPRLLKYTAEDYPVREKIELPGDLWEIAYGIALLGRYFPAYLFEKLFEEEGLNRLIYRRALEMLAGLGVVDIPEDPRPRIPDFISLAEKTLGDRKEKIRSLVRNRLLAWVDSGRLRPCFNLLGILSELGGEGDNATILKALRGDVLNGTCGGIDEAVKNRYFNRLTGAENARALLWVYKTLKALTSRGSREIREAFMEAPPLDVEYPGLRSQILANQISFDLGIKDITAASSAAKEAMLLNQQLKGGALSSYRYFSLVNLSKQRLDDALEYISFAMEQAEKAELNEELILAAYFAAGIQFLYGNLSKADRFTLKAEKAAVGLGHAEWAARIRFLRGKIRFETGYYEDAFEIFKSLAEDGEDSASSLRAGTLASWINRAGVFLRAGGWRAGVPAPSFALQESPCSGGGPSDASLFEIEAAYLSGNYREAAALAEKWRASSFDFPEEDFFFTEQPDWHSGFAQCEFMLVPEKMFRNRFVAVYHALARGRLELSREGKEELVNSIQRLTREEMLLNADPNEAFYVYAQYRILKETGAAQVDLNTAVSMAFKRLQRRAGRIDDNETRQTFLTGHYWNGALSLAAREYKLI